MKVPDSETSSQLANRQTKLLVVTTQMSDGGAERFASTLLKSLDRESFSVELCTLRDDRGYELPGDLQVYSLGYSGVLSLPRTVRRLSHLIASTQPNVVLSCVNATNIVTGLAVKRCPLLVRWFARVGNSPRQADRGLRRFVLRHLYRDSDLVIANAEALRDEMIECYGLKNHPMAVALNPCDLPQIRRAASVGQSPIKRADYRIVACGRLANQKRYDVMLRALASLQMRESVELVICGDGPLRRSLERLANHLQIRDQVTFLGFVENPHAIMASADLFLLTSDYEGLPNALIEAQALGVPAISTDCQTGPREIVEEGVTGLLVPVRDAHALSAAVSKLLDDVDLRQSMSVAAVASVEKRFALDVVMDDWQALLG